MYLVLKNMHIIAIILSSMIIKNLGFIATKLLFLLIVDDFQKCIELFVNNI